DLSSIGNAIVDPYVNAITFVSLLQRLYFNSLAELFFQFQNKAAKGAALLNITVGIADLFVRRGNQAVRLGEVAGVGGAQIRLKRFRGILKLSCVGSNCSRRRKQHNKK